MRLSKTSRGDKRAWTEAPDFRALCHAAADWLEGRNAYHPWHGTSNGLDKETGPLIKVLAAANRRGFFTLDSQPGEDSRARGSRWQQRAAVDGFVHDQRLLKNLVRDANRAGLETVTYAPGDPDKGRIPATLQDGRPVTGFGSVYRPVDLEAHWQEIGRGAYRQLAQAHQLTIIEPDWGPSDALWRMLAGAVR